MRRALVVLGVSLAAIVSSFGLDLTAGHASAGICDIAGQYQSQGTSPIGSGTLTTTLVITLVDNVDSCKVNIGLDFWTSNGDEIDTFLSTETVHGVWTTYNVYEHGSFQPLGDHASGVVNWGWYPYSEYMKGSFSTPGPSYVCLIAGCSGPNGGKIYLPYLVVNPPIVV